MNTKLTVFGALLLAASLPGCARHAVNDVDGARLATLQQAAATPELIAVQAPLDDPRLDSLEAELTAWRRPAGDSEQPAMRSLSYYVHSSMLSECAQLCGLKVGGGERIPGQFMTFNCHSQITNLREFLPTEGNDGLAFHPEQVNLLVNQRPASLQRFKALSGSEATLLAWEGADRGFALFTPSASLADAERLIAVARSIDAAEEVH